MTSLALEVQQLEKPDPVLTNKIVTYLKSQGVFDEFRRECMADVDTKPAYQNLRQRVEGTVKSFLRKNPWTPEMNKNHLRDKLRKYIHSGGFLDMGVDRIVDQVVNPKIYSSFLPKVEEVVQLCLKLDDNDKPMFVAPPRLEEPPQPLCFKDRHNLAPRAKVPAPLTGPRLPIIPNIEALKPPEPLDKKDSLTEEPGTPELDESSDKNYNVDDTDVGENADNDDEDDEEEESPPFEPHSEHDRLILGLRTDSSDDSSDIQVVTSVVDDDLEEQIDKEEDKLGKEKSDIKEADDDDDDEESSSDEYVPKTPTINMEGSDGSVIEFNSISEYRQYQTKTDEENFGDVEEEVVCSQWMDESSSHMKEERSSNEEDSVVGSRKRKLQNSTFDDASNSSVEKGSTSDEGRTSTIIDVSRKKLKLKLKDELESEVEKASTSDEEKSIKSNSFNYDKRQPREYQHESETEKGITSDEEKSSRSNYFSGKKMPTDEHESEIEKGYTSDEDKTFRSHYFSNSKSKLEKYGSKTEKGNSSDEEKSNKSNEFSRDELELEEENERLKGSESRYFYNDDSNYSKHEQSLEMVESKSRQDINDLKQKRKSSSSSTKDSSHHHHRHGHKESSSHHRRSKDKVNDEENKGEGSVSSHLSKDRNDDRHESSRDQLKNKERKKSESSSSHSKSKHHSKNKDKLDNNGNNKDLVEDDLKHKHHKDSSREHDKEKKKHDSYDKGSERKKDHESSQNVEKHSKHSSKHVHSSNKHSHRSSSERHKSDKKHKHRESSDNHRKHDKKSVKDDKQDSKKKHREHCKTSKNDESRRSTDRDSNGPSGRGHTSSSSKSSSNKSNVETSVDSGERTSSNSDNAVSDNIEVLPCADSKFDASCEQGITSPDHKGGADGWIESDNISSDQNESYDENLFDGSKTDVCSDSSVEEKYGRKSRSDKTDECYRKYSDKNEAKINIDEAELVQFEGIHITKNDLVDVKIDSIKKSSLLECHDSTSDSPNEMLTQNIAESACSTHDNSSEKENIDLTLDNTEPVSGNLSSPDSEENLVKFKKPKIAANIFEVKKIMLARRKMKHMEKKRLKILTKPTAQLPSVNCDEESQEEFKGFGESLSHKKESYDILIQRLKSEIESEEFTDDNPNLVTSWIDVSHDLDEYIENTLKGKVHRKTRVRVPPISEEHYKYDPELNAYILLESADELPLTREEKFDGNLNNLKTNLENKNIFYNGLSIESHAGTLNGSNLKSTYKSSKNTSVLACDLETLTKSEDGLSDLPNIKTQNLTKTSNEITSKQESEMKSCEVSALVSTESIKSSSVISKTKPEFNLTFNEYYKEILKEKNEAQVQKTKTPQTVVKITNANDRLSEEVVVKKVTVLHSSRQMYQVPTITKSEPKLNGQISKSSPKQNQMPFISRVNKSKNIKAEPTPTKKTSPVNGNISPDFTIKFEGDISSKISRDLINTMIGIEVCDEDQGDVKNTSPPLQEQREVEQRRTRVRKPAVSRQQRYDSTDLYKPRPQLTSRRGRHSLPAASTEPDADVTIIETRRKRSAAAINTAVPTKQRR